jgi:putative ABC transport system permease protein
MNPLAQDLVLACRVLRRKPSLTVVIVLTLTLGIGANTAIFSAVKGLLLDSPFREPARLVFVAERVQAGDGAALSQPDLLEYQKESRTFESLAGFRLQSWNMTGTSEPERVDGLQASAGLFTTLGVRPLVGRVFSAEEDQRGGAHVVVIGEALWRRLFGGERGVLGRAIILDGNPYTVIGVMPAAFQIWRRADLFTPIGQRPASADRRDHSIYAVGRLRPTVSLEQARAALDVIAARLSVTYRELHAGRTSSVTPLRERSLGDLRRALWVLSAISVLVLVLGCINVTTLLHAHGIERIREISIRVALGAGRARLVRQMLTESLLLGLAGSLAGLLVAHWAVQLLSAMIPRFVAEAIPLRLDCVALIFNCLAGVIVGLMSGAIPAWLLTRAEVPSHLKEGAGGTAPLGRTRIQDGLVVAQVTLAVLTLVGASLMLRSFARLLAVPLGIEAKGVILADLTLPYPKYSDWGQLWRFYGSALSEAGQEPGVHSAALMTTAPMSFVPWNLSYAVEGEQPPAPGQEPECDYAAVAGDYFGTLGIPVVEGRAFTARDDARGIPVAIVDRSFVRRHFPGQSAVGRRLSFPAMGGRWLQIVGVVDEVRNWGPDGASLPGIYLPLLQRASPYVTLAVRTRGATSPIPGMMRSAVRRVDPDQPLANVRTMDEVIGRTAAARRLAAKAVTGFSVIALSLAALGLYGTLSRSVVRRSREIGVRVALGARRGDVLSLFVWHGLRLSGLGLALGLMAALPLTPLLSSLLFETAPRDPVAIVVVPSVLVSIALLASFIPARRAAKVDPMVALRCE